MNAEKNRAKMSLKLKDFAKSDAGSENVSRGTGEDSSEDEISYLPPGSSSSSRQREKEDRPHYDEVPRIKDEKPWFGPSNRDGSIKVQYPSMINGYGVDSDQMQQMESMGLPTGFSFSQSQPERQRKGDKKTFYCEICLIELNSLDTMKSHVAGVKHMKKKLQLDERKKEQFRKGEISEDQCREGPGVIPIPNPVNTKIKVPVRLHEKIKAATEPVVGLDFVKEWIAVSDPEMEPYYECRLCGNKGIANGMFSHIMGYKHRQQFVEEIYKDDHNVLDLSQSELLGHARRHAENGDNLNERIKTRRSDEEYPWPAGKAPWSVERGGTGIPPDRARENWGKNADSLDDKLTVERQRGRGAEESARGREGGSRGLSLTSLSSLPSPTDQQEALKMISIAEKLLEKGLDFLSPELSSQEFRLMKMTTCSVFTKLLSKRRETTNGHDSPGERSRSENSSGQRRRSSDSRSPPQSAHLPPPVKRERRSPSSSRPGSSKTAYYGDHDNRERQTNGRNYSYEEDPRPSHSHRREYDRERTRDSYRGQSPSQYRRRY